MAIIEVDHKYLREVASACTAYCEKQDSEMRTADSEIQAMLTADWTGGDAREFRMKWVAIDSRTSQTVKLRNAVEALGENLTACADEYEKAQGEAYNDANHLPKYLYW